MFQVVILTHAVGHGVGEGKKKKRKKYINPYPNLFKSKKTENKHINYGHLSFIKMFS